MSQAITEEQLGDPLWRLCNLYWIIDEQARRVPFVPNEEQRKFLREYWYLNIILKARQLGFTTLIDLILLDQCVFVPNFTAGVIAHTLPDAEKIFRNKVKFAWDNLPAEVRAINPLVKETTSELVWANGSSIGVSTSMRSGTMQGLHVSEYGKIARLRPDKSKEIRLGSFNAVHAGSFIFVESTAEGRGGDFYELVAISKAIRDARIDLTPMDFKLHFYPWWRKAEYTMAPKGVTIPADFRAYFKMLEALQDPAYPNGIRLTAAQKAWYVKKARQLSKKDDTKYLDMKQEFPSFEDEAFEAANEEKYFGTLISRLRRKGQIRPEIPVLRKRVNQYWDIGLDTTSIWFHQYAALQHRFVDYYENANETIEHYLEEVAKKPYLMGTIYLPHDAEDRSLQTKVSVADSVRAAFPNAAVIIVPRVARKRDAINAARNVLPQCWFHGDNCDLGLKRLETYRKEWNEALGVWSENPVHDQASHGSSAYEQFATGWKPEHETLGRPLPTVGKTVGDRIAGY